MFGLTAKLLLLLQLSLVSLALSQPISLSSSSLLKRAPDKVGYLFIHFYDNYRAPGDYSTYPAGEQIFGHISNGNDALFYKPLKGGAPLLTSDVGTKGVRDMYITAVGGFGGKFLSRSLVIWDSEGASLTNWKAPRLVQVVPDNFRMAWAPEAIWLEDEQRFLVYWSSNKFADASHSGDPDYDKNYSSYTTDFVTFTAPEVFMDLGNNTVDIDLTIGHGPTNGGDQYVRFFKDESVYKVRGQVSNSGIQGPWLDIDSSTSFIDNNNQAEAPIYIQENTSDSADNGIDQYGFTDLGFPSGMPTQLKHGSIKPLTQAQYDEINAAWA
ncbi:related to Crg1 protein (Putative arabinase) [Ustilago bromivora]|uniref:Related to Crg1 protein (Putative arabinase) n=1 Tax=Ustilago bromivora TaxID=307758 RepID=A0A1K0G0F7_9BASI|nr:related to Crg1 protein (Putative arabinase) [Ustilago bromivora]SYW84054.1 related to Crg1 protein (Putative arabinase) [Ustilago bromivora]